MKRYDHWSYDMEEMDDGYYVKYTEAQSAIDAERTRADRAEARVKILECELDLLRKKLVQVADERDALEERHPSCVGCVNVGLIKCRECKREDISMRDDLWGDK